MKVALLIGLFLISTKFIFASDIGILILAHGGGKEWNETIKKAVNFLEKEYPVEIAFGMANPVSIKRGLEKLKGNGVKKVIAIPLFISSHSPIIRQLEYLFSKKDKMEDDPIFMLNREEYYKFKELFDFINSLPSSLSWWIWEELPDREIFKMIMKRYIDDGSRLKNIVLMYQELMNLYKEKSNLVKPIDIELDIYLAKPMDDHPTVAEIICDRALELSKEPSKEILVIVAHGPNAEEDNAKWLESMESIAKQCQKIVIEKRGGAFKSIFSITVRDDAPEPLYNQAREHLRAIVRQAAMWGEIIVVPLLVAEGRVSRSIEKRLEGLKYRWNGKTILPSKKFENFVIDRVKEGLAYFN